jgi:hypothetical protein
MPQIILNQAHTHAGVDYAAGKRLEVDTATADWLVEQGVARLRTAASTTAGTNTETETKTATRKDSQS